MKKLPDEFTNRMKEILGDDFSEYEKALEEAPVKGFRINTEKITPEDFEKLNNFSAGKIPYVENGYYLDYERIGNHPYHHAGMIYIQEPGAMAPAECVEINPDWKILDMCAAPGGKSTQLKNKLGENGILVSNEIIPSRCKILTGNIERLGLKNVVTTCMDTSRLAKTFPDTFDLIMVDAPCSGLGTIHKKPDIKYNRKEEDVEALCRVQKKILESAAKYVKSGGVLVYATCTILREENEMQTEAFLKEHTDFEKESEKLYLAHETGGSGFYICRMRRFR